ncbi:MAG: LON peptidase substrate-binding domain-containing protein [Kiritimatiellae bacterium]|nr:LON peptidase substrate-binding domain-containing protein [Kiritimatiellia bacterium]
MNDVTTFSLEQPIPVFPLNGSVLLPYSSVPIHIFEPRYRSMVEDALDAVGLLALGSFLETDLTEDQYLYDTPPLHERVGLGFVEQYRKLDDGRFVIVLRGLVRAVVREEVESPLYRSAYLNPATSILGDDAQMASLRERFKTLLKDSKLIKEDALDDVLEKVEKDPLDRFVDELAGWTISDAETLDMLLGEDRVAVRAEHLIDHLETAKSVGLG